MLAKLKEYIVICLHIRTQLANSELSRIKQTIESSRPHYWEEIEPGIFLAYFAIRRGGRTRSIKLTAGIGSLKKPGTPFFEIGTGRAIGKLITEANWYGKILTAPFGDAMNQAMKKAREDADKSAGISENKQDQEKP